MNRAELIELKGKVERGEQLRAHESVHLVELLEKQLESDEVYCEKCKMMTGPALHSGCDRSEEEGCAWNNKKSLNKISHEE